MKLIVATALLLGSLSAMRFVDKKQLDDDMTAGIRIDGTTIGSEKQQKA